MVDSLNFDAASAKFLSWFKAQPGASFHDGLQITNLTKNGRGRGITAIRDIPAGTDLFTIPRSAIISIDTSELTKALPHHFTTSDENDTETNVEEAEDLPKPWLDLILIILREVLNQSSSKWEPYLSILPSQASSFDTLMFWTEDELAGLQASAITSKIGRKSANAMFERHIIPLVRQNQHVFLQHGTLPNDQDLLQMCHAVGSLIMSYAFDLQPDDDEDEGVEEDGWVEDRTKISTMGMVPMADMLNADAEFNAHLSHGEDELTMTSIRDIKAGEEVLNYYGPLPNAELLRRYGYTSPKHERYDVVEIMWPTVKADLINSLRDTDGDNETLSMLLQQVEEDEGLSEDDGFILEREAGDPTEEGLCPSPATFQKYPDDLVSLISQVVTETLSNKDKKRTSSSEMQQSRVKLTVLEILQSVTQRRLQQYQTSIEEDSITAASQAAANRHVYAIDVRMGEKRLLKEALAWVAEKQEKYRQSIEEESPGRMTKRVKRT